MKKLKIEDKKIELSRLKHSRDWLIEEIESMPYYMDADIIAHFRWNEKRRIYLEALNEQIEALEQEVSNMPS